MSSKSGITVAYKLSASIITETSWICDLVFSVWVSSSWENCEILYFLSWVVAKWLGVITWVMFDYFTGDKDSVHFCTHIWGYVFCLSKDNRGNDCLKHYSLVKLHCKSRYLLPLSSDLLVMQKLTWWIVFPVTVIVKLINCVPISFILCWVVFEEVQSGTRVLWGNESNPWHPKQIFCWWTQDLQHNISFFLAWSLFLFLFLFSTQLRGRFFLLLLQEEFKHWFTPREGIVDSFVIKVSFVLRAPSWTKFLSGC